MPPISARVIRQSVFRPVQFARHSQTQRCSPLASGSSNALFRDRSLHINNSVAEVNARKCVLHLRVHAIVVINVNTVLGLLLFCQFDASSATSTSPIEYCALHGRDRSGCHITGARKLVHYRLYPWNCRHPPPPPLRLLTRRLNTFCLIASTYFW